MSDFLTNLAARSTGSAETIRPRVPALFEPSGVRNPLPVDSEIAPIEPGKAGEPDVRPEGRPPAMPQPAAAMPAARTEAANHQSVPAGALSASPAPHTTSQNPSTAALTTTPKWGAPLPAELPPAPLISPKPLLPPPAPKPSPALALPRMSPSGDRQPTVPRREASAGKEPPARPAAWREEPSPPVAVQPVRPASTIVEPRVTPRIETPSQAAAPSHAKSPETVIHVTIGRIEVRATPETPPARKVPAAPVTGLDEYLRSRAKRGNA